MFGILKKIFGTAQTRLLKKYEKIVREVCEKEKALHALSDEQLRAKTKEFQKRLEQGETVDALLPEAYAVVKNACRRLCGTDVHVSGYEQKWDMIPYDVQILGAVALHYGAIAEMQTGEGKTLTSTMPLYLNALTKKSVHLVTVNDYLAQRDCQWIGAVFRFLGLSVAALTHDVPPHERKEIYESDIVYGTASEFGFDYLRDNSMAQIKEEQCQRGHYFSIIDEVDSILIDEARTPLIISGPSATSRHLYSELKEGVEYLVKQQRDLCNRLATDARKTLEQFGLLTEESTAKLSKEKDAEAKEALKKLWLVGKGTPQNKILKRVREIPELRAQIENWDIYYYAEPNKQEKAETLAELLIIVDEKSNEFEMTDKGIQAWAECLEGHSTNDFLMLDLGHEYALIDKDETLSDTEKMQKRTALREEDSRRKERAHNLRQLLRAHLTMERDVDYIISEEKIVIIDENTGRPQPGRRFSDGLHQALEAKEGVSIQRETQTYATITLQNYFRMYQKLAGMTGTALTEAGEFKEIYKLDVLAIPTHKPCHRTDADDEVYMTEREKYNAILKEIQKIHNEGRPILVGTESVEASEKLSRILRQHKLPHTVLNAKHHEKEAETIAQAGEKGAIVVATNMAGRGTDIKLKQGVPELGGLHVIGTTRHQSRRIDRQLRGRCARQGDPGSSKFFVSFEDSLMRLFTSPNVTSFLLRFRPPEGEPIQAKMLNKSIETAQKRVEQRNYTIRKHTLEYDDVMNKQREEIYAFRNDLLHRISTPTALAEHLLTTVCSHRMDDFLQKGDEKYSLSWNLSGYLSWLMTHFPIEFKVEDCLHFGTDPQKVSTWVEEKALAFFRHKMALQVDAIERMRALSKEPSRIPEGHALIEDILCRLMIPITDSLWQAHLQELDFLRTEVNLHSVAQKDPLQEFKHEAFALFDRFSKLLKEEVVHALFKFQIFIPPSLKTKAPSSLAPSSLSQSAAIEMEDDYNEELTQEKAKDLPESLSMSNKVLSEATPSKRPFLRQPFLTQVPKVKISAIPEIEQIQEDLVTKELAAKETALKNNLPE